MRPVEQPDAVGETVRLCAEAGASDGASGRRRLLKLTDRPTRATRRRYRLAGVAMLLLLVAVGSVAFRLDDKASEWRRTAQQERARAIEMVRETWPNLPPSPIRNPIVTAQSALASEKQDPGPEPPPPPPPIFAEAKRVLSILAAPEEEVLLERIQLDQDQNNALEFRLPPEERELRVELEVQLTSDERAVDWRSIGAQNPGRPKLQVIWRR